MNISNSSQSHDFYHGLLAHAPFRRMERLQKIIARAGVASRRQAEELILAGKVRVNGRLVHELGVRADPQRDHIKVDGKLIRAQRLEYYALNKPRQVLSSVRDDKGRRVVVDLLSAKVRIYPVGRLDYDSEGLMLLTNDGELSRQLTRAGGVEKYYRIKVRGNPSRKQLNLLRRGIRLVGKRLEPCSIEILKEGNNSWLAVRLKQGKNRQIRRMFGYIHHPVMRLRRVAIGSLSLGRLKPGESRRLSTREVRKLYEASSPKYRS